MCVLNSRNVDIEVTSDSVAVRNVLDIVTRVSVRRVEMSANSITRVAVV